MQSRGRRVLRRRFKLGRTDRGKTQVSSPPLLLSPSPTCTPHPPLTMDLNGDSEDEEPQPVQLSSPSVVSSLGSDSDDDDDDLTLPTAPAPAEGDVTGTMRVAENGDDATRTAGSSYLSSLSSRHALYAPPLLLPRVLLPPNNSDNTPRDFHPLPRRPTVLLPHLHRRSRSVHSSLCPPSYAQ